MLRAVGVTCAIAELRGGTLWVLDHRSRLSPSLGRKAAVATTTYPGTPPGQFLNSLGILQRVGCGREGGREERSSKLHGGEARLRLLAE